MFIFYFFFNFDLIFLKKHNKYIRYYLKIIVFNKNIIKEYLNYTIDFFIDLETIILINFISKLILLLMRCFKK